eukprot:scaffold98368_cov61-Phaeocystis_antarctica.AAC.6
MQTKLTADSNVSGNAHVSYIKTDAMRTKPVGGALAMLTNVGTLKCVAVLVVRGGREARPEQAASREARPEPAGSLSLTEVSPHPHGYKPPLCPARFSFLSVLSPHDLRR